MHRRNGVYGLLHSRRLGAGLPAPGTERELSMKIYDESLYCQECGTEISFAESLFGQDLCDECYELTLKMMRERRNAARRAARQAKRRARNKEENR